MADSVAAASIYVNAFVVGGVLMGFEMLGSRYLFPYFGGGIGTWAGLISMVLIALSIGYLAGGAIVDRHPSPRVIAIAVALAAAYLAAVPSTADYAMAWILRFIGGGLVGILLAAAALVLMPLSLLGTFSPVAIRLLIRSTTETGRVAGLIYGISTIGNVVGILFTTFTLIPTIGSRSITYLYAGILAVCSTSLFLISKRGRLVFPLVILLTTPQFVFGGDSILAKADYPEGPLWHRLRLYYGEMMRDRVVMSPDLRTTATFWQMPGCGPVSIAPYRDDELLVLCHLIHKVVRVSLSGTTLAIIDHDDTGRPIVHPNDSSADDKGGVYFTASGLFSLSAPATGAVLYLDRNGKLRRLVDGIRYANGIAVDLRHHRMLVSEHLNRRVLAFPLMKDGRLGKSTVFFDLNRLVLPRVNLDPLAGPDGLELDLTSRLLVAEYGAGRIHLVGPNGAWLGMLGGLMKYVTDMALLPGGRAAVTEAEVNDVPPYPGDVVILDGFIGRFHRR